MHSHGSSPCWKRHGNGSALMGPWPTEVSISNALEMGAVEHLLIAAGGPQG